MSKKPEPETIYVPLTKAEIVHLIRLMQLVGFHEKRELSESVRKNRTEYMKIMGKIMKKLRIGLES